MIRYYFYCLLFSRTIIVRTYAALLSEADSEALVFRFLEPDGVGAGAVDVLGAALSAAGFTGRRRGSSSSEE